MSEIPEELRYTPDHEWILMEDEFNGRCGITDYAQEMLTDIVFVELPEIGFEVRKGDPVAVVESMKSVSDVFAPVSGRIIAVNTTLEDSPGLINTSPYDRGWIFRIEVTDRYEFDQLMDADGYQEYLETGDR